MTFIEIETKTKEYAVARDAVSAIISVIEEETAVIKKKYLQRLKKSVAVMIERQADLKAAIEDGSPLFTKPRTRVFNGIKVGFQKEKGKMTWADEEQVIKLIHKHFDDQADILLKKTERPIKDALAPLSAADLKRLGITITNDADTVVIKATDSEIDKFVEALLKEDDMKEAAA